MRRRTPPSCPRCSRSAAEGVEALYRTLPAVRALREVGYRLEAIPESVALILPVVPLSNPRAADEEALAAILRRAYDGEPISRD